MPGHTRRRATGTLHPAEKRIDPDNGMAYTSKEFVAYYRSEYEPGSIRAYWDECRVANQGHRKTKETEQGKFNTLSGAKLREQWCSKCDSWHTCRCSSNEAPKARPRGPQRAKTAGRQSNTYVASRVSPEFLAAKTNHAAQQQPSDTLEFLTVRKNLAEMLKSERFMHRRGAGFHVMFGPEEMEPYFERIKNGEVGQRLKTIAGDVELAGTSNLKIWRMLLKTLKFDGVDFEHTYGLAGGSQGDIDSYALPETIIMTHTMLLVPVMQLVAPFKGNLDHKDCKRTNRRPLIIAAMVGDCVKGSFFERLRETCPADADLLRHPGRLGSKTRSLLEALGKSKFTNIHVQASLPGAGAFGGAGDVLAKEFVAKMDAALSSTEVAEHFAEVCLYGPPTWYEGPLETCSEAGRKCLRAVGFGSAGDHTRMGDLPPGLEAGTRVILAGFDPVSLAPHGVQFRCVSLEGQLSHGTDLLVRLGYYRKTGVLADVRVEAGEKLGLGGSPGEEVAEYRAWRYINALPQYVCRQKDRRCPNGDCLPGWALEIEDTTMAEILPTTMDDTTL